MKIRNDFVTNSSSSSFIIGFSGDKDMYDVLRENLSDIYSDYLIDLILEEADSAGIVGFDGLEEFVKDEWWFNEDCSKEIESLKEIAKSKGFDKFFKVEVGDHDCDSIVEHQVLPYLGCTLTGYSHH
jgi:hypothetical protein